MLVARIQRTLLERRLVAPKDHVVVACSGGPDSVAMTHALARLAPEVGITLTVTSIDHGLRPEAADEVRGVAALAEGLRLPFVPLSVTVPAGPSRQGRAREARYEALRALRDARGARQIAVGHTLDDQAETVLDRLLRGASIRGLAGIAPVRDDGVIRPLLDCRREEVLAYLGHHGLPFVVNPSNDDARYLRSRIRREVLPLLGELDRGVVTHLAKLADDAREAQATLEMGARALLARASRHVEGGRDLVGLDARGLDARGLDARGLDAHGLDAVGLDVVALRGATAATRAEALRLHLGEVLGADPRRSHIEDAERLLASGRGEVRLDARRALVLDGDSLVIASVEDRPRRGRA